MDPLNEVWYFVSAFGGGPKATVPSRLNLPPHPEQTKNPMLALYPTVLLSFVQYSDSAAKVVALMRAITTLALYKYAPGVFNAE